MTTTIWERTNTALAGLGLPMAANIYVAATAAALADVFLVFNLVSSPPEQHADDDETMRSYRMQVTYYNRNGLATMPDINSAMTAAGFTRGPLRELPYNSDTRHFGLALEYLYLEDE